MQPIAKKALKQRTSADGLGRGMEFALITLLFLGLGYLVDRWLGTKPIFMIVFVVLALVGQFASLKYGYEQRMKELEEQRAANTRQGRPVQPHKGKAAAS